MTDDGLYHLPPDLPADLATVRVLLRGLDQLREAVADLATQHAALAHRVNTAATARGVADGAEPGPLRWAGLDRDSADQVWGWLIDWVDWFVSHYQLHEEIPACWAQHWPLVEELTALCAAWHDATNPHAPADALLRWHESLHRARPRLREWDDHTRCRNGTHTTYHPDLAWPDTWQQHALQVAAADIATRPPATPNGPPHGGESA
jgi:hypothetical protein